MNKFVTISIILFFTKVSAQDKFIENVAKPLLKNQLYIEKVFVHTNKTLYKNEETIWFQAYVGNKKNEPSESTSLLYVNLINDTGDIIYSQNIYINKGIGVGQIELQNNLTSGKYYIQAFTNYMKNFGDSNCFMKEINVMGLKNENKKIAKKHYDIQLFPENGYLVENLENVIAVKSLFNGLGNQFEGKVFNTKNEEVVNFKSKHLGMSSFKFIIKENENYYASIITNDTLIKIEIPKALKNEIKLDIINNKSEKLIVKLSSNLDIDLINNNYTLLFHQKNNLFNYITLSDKNLLNSNIEIDKKKLSNGINQITLFKNSNPIGIRKIYIEHSNENTEIAIEKVKTSKDSITCKLKIETHKIPLKANLSLSVLLENDIKNDESSSIKSAFYLSPYIRGFIEKPSYYFNLKNINRLEYIDLLLLTQGFEKYNIDEYITDLNPTEKYSFENGFNLKGSVKPTLTSNLGLISKSNLLIQKVNVINSKFNFYNLLLYKNDEVKIAFLNDSNELIQPKEITIDENIYDTSSFKNNIKSNYEVVNRTIENQDTGSINLNNTTILREVTLVEKSRLNNRESEIQRKYKKNVFDIGAYYELELPENKNKNEELFLSYFLKDQNITLVNWKGLENYLEISPTKEAVLYVNGKKLRSDEIPSLRIKIKDVDAFLKQPFQNFVKYQIFTNDNYNNDIIELFDKFVIKNGYDRNLTYYNPAYDFSEKNKVIEIDFKTNLKTNEQGEVEFKIQNCNSVSKLLFVLEGFSTDGKLISEQLYN